jgi:hypothetical protein
VDDARSQNSAGPGPVVALMGRAQSGDRDAFRELQARGEAEGIDYVKDWSSHLLLYRIQDRVSPTNLIARSAVALDLAATARDLAEPGDGPIERLLVGRVALCLVDCRQAELEHVGAIISAGDPLEAEPLDRRRDRANRRLLATLKTLAEIRRLNRRVVEQVTWATATRTS